MVEVVVGGRLEGAGAGCEYPQEASEVGRDDADRATDPGAPLSLGALALACPARRSRGWAVHIRSPYLPPRLLEAAGRR
ncbi:Imm49 family immunity protein [Kitasatospora sp. NPDC058190]|uniref:Imm49 family immunity protein n=1 Tax=Kitasatospora sp. NPDC058190 TaxID=3346371 RepID=UPI0036DD540C